MKLRTDLILRRLGREYIIVEPGQDMVDMSKVFTFNDTAVLIWERLQGREFTLETVVGVLLENYDVKEDIARRDAFALLQTFKEHGLLTE
ncbi:PqqD family protein [Sphingobacterium sp. DN00404]|uniref:PqqD family protein n=1 Tax=Sphingobacterium micropteri TaxID=2763501 RepID=A0ABR7YLP8_9SPHI|nr:PqqD family protein [Sphingobacterium micropteri]MBD1432243.1 PqqD family protein [Sphingobacterium micropteri]